eukprot:9470614-Pyramimonas_sp.AAC.1
MSGYKPDVNRYKLRDSYVILVSLYILWETVGNWTQGEKRGRVSGVSSASLPLLAHEDPVYYTCARRPSASWASCAGVRVIGSELSAAEGFSAMPSAVGGASAAVAAATAAATTASGSISASSCASASAC